MSTNFSLLDQLRRTRLILFLGLGLRQICSFLFSKDVFCENQIQVLSHKLSLLWTKSHDHIHWFENFDYKTYWNKLKREVLPIKLLKQAKNNFTSTNVKHLPISKWIETSRSQNNSRTYWNFILNLVLCFFSFLEDWNILQPVTKD